MSSTPVMSFTVDISGSTMTANAVPISTPAGLPGAYIQVDCSKNLFFSSPFTYSVTANASGVVTSIVASGTANIDSSHIVTQSQTYAGWRNSVAAQPIDISANFIIGGVRTFKFDPSFAYVNSTPSNLGDIIMTVAAHALLGRRPNTDVQAIITNFSVASSSLRTNIAAAIRSTLGTQTNCDFIFQSLILANGPITQVPTAPGVTNYTLTPDSTYSNMVIALNIINFPISVTYYGSERTLTLNVLPIRLNLI